MSYCTTWFTNNTYEVGACYLGNIYTNDVLRKYAEKIVDFVRTTEGDLSLSIYLFDVWRYFVDEQIFPLFTFFL